MPIEILFIIAYFPLLTAVLYSLWSK